MNAPNANLTDEQRERNRLVFLLIEAVARANVPANRDQINAVAGHIVDIMHEHNLIMAWLSDLEAKMRD